MPAVYLNVLGVIVVVEPSDSFCLDTALDPVSVHGVNKLSRLCDLEEQVEEVSEESQDDEDLGEVL